MPRSSLLLQVRYRSARHAAVALTPAMLACVATVATLVAAGTALTIHVMSLLLLISLGVDFGISFVDTADTIEEIARTLVSILTASVTTILSFDRRGAPRRSPSRTASSCGPTARSTTSGAARSW